MKNQGVSLIEILLVLALVAVATILSIQYYSSARQSEEIQQLKQEYTAIYQAVLHCLNSIQQYGGAQMNGMITTPGLCANLNTLSQTGYFSPEYIQNPWSGTNSVVINNNIIEVSASNVPQLVCTKITASLPSFIPAKSSASFSNGACVVSINIAR